MKISRLLVVAAILIGSLVLRVSAQAATVTVGSPLTAAFGTGEYKSSLTMANLALPEPGAQVTSPVTGMVVRWRLKNSTGTYSLRVLKHVSGATFEGAGTSAPQTPVSTATQTYETSLPIQAGEAIGLNGEGEGKVGFAPGVTGAEYLYWGPPLKEGQFLAGTGNPDHEVAFNADIVPQPNVSSIAPATGPATGGTSVVIEGKELVGASAVKFGSTGAASFTVDSASKVTATSPPGAAGAVDVTVTTPGGTSPAGAVDRFTYTATATATATGTNNGGPSSCIVPKLKGKMLKAARKAAIRAGCAVSKVKKLNGATAKTGRVVKQSPKPSKSLPAGTKVAITLR
jgi:hypothetical protein